MSSSAELADTQDLMHSLANKDVLVIGLGSSGLAAAHLLQRRESSVTVIDQADTPALQRESARLRDLGITVHLGISSAPNHAFDLAVLSPGVPAKSKLVREVAARNVPVIGELELGFQNSRCLNVAITGTNGKTTTTELIARMLTHCHRKTVAAGNIGLPLS